MKQGADGQQGEVIYEYPRRRDDGRIDNNGEAASVGPQRRSVMVATAITAKLTAACAIPAARIGAPLYSKTPYALAYFAHR